MSDAVSKDFTDYAGRFPTETQRLLRKMRDTIRKAAPVWYAAHAHHIGFYPGASAIRAFKSDLARYTFAKGSVRFPFDEALPLALISRMVKFRVAEQRAKRR